MLYRLTCAGFILAASGSAAFAQPPNLQTPAPVIYLADNLDEKDNLGWCIDTLGRGFGEHLQAHSCKPQGGDVQFSFEPVTALIRSVAFPEYCMQHNMGSEPVFGLATCEPGNDKQAFSYNEQTMAISPADDASQCVTVGAASRSAGPFMSRTLLMQPCSQVDASVREWIITAE